MATDADDADAADGIRGAVPRVGALYLYGCSWPAETIESYTFPPAGDLETILLLTVTKVYTFLYFELTLTQICTNIKKVLEKYKKYKKV